MYIDDGRSITDTFVGYKCPFFVCDIVAPTHYVCQKYRGRLNTISKFQSDNDEFLNMFAFNWNQFLIRTYGNIDSRIIES